MGLLTNDSIKYQAETKLLDLVYEASLSSSFKKKRPELNRAVKIRYFLKSLQYSEVYMTEKQKSQVYQCLTDVSQITSFPTAPVLTVTQPPAVLTGIPGTPGLDGDDGEAGPTGPTGPSGDGAVTITLTGQTSTNVIVDEIENASSPTNIGARWDFYAYRSDSPSIVIIGTIVGGMNNGTGINFTSDATTIGTSTAYFELQENSPSLRLHFRRSAGTETWVIHAKRYMITDFTLA